MTGRMPGHFHHLEVEVQGVDPDTITFANRLHRETDPGVDGSVAGNVEMLAERRRAADVVVVVVGQ